MTVEDLASDTVLLLAEKVRLYFASFFTYNSGDNDEQ